MPVECLSDDQGARYGRFAEEPAVQELEEFFRLDTAALEVAGTKRRPHNRLGWAVQWGTVRMLGTFLTTPADVPTGVAHPGPARRRHPVIPGPHRLKGGALQLGAEVIWGRQKASVT